MSTIEFIHFSIMTTKLRVNASKEIDAIELISN